MRGLPSLRSAGRLTSRTAASRGVGVAIAAFCERLLAPAVVYALVSRGELDALVAALSLSLVFSARGAVQRSFAARTEAELYRRVVGSVLKGDVLRSSVLPDEEARANLFEGLHQVGVLIAETLPNLLANVLAAGTLACVLALSQPFRVTLIAAAALVVGGAALLVSRGRVERAQEDTWRAWGKMVDEVDDVFDGRLELVASGRDRDFFERFVRTTRSWSDKARRAGRIAGVAGRLPLLVLAVAVGGAAVLDARLQGTAWTATFARAALLASCAPAFVGIAQGLQDLVRNERRLQLLSRLLDIEASPATGTLAPPASPKSIEWKALSFAYDGVREVLRGASFAWHAGQLLALAGANGSGKSTCIRALLALGMPTDGQVLVDRVPVTNLDIVRWRMMITYLPQRAYVPSRATVRDCLRFVDRDVAEEVMLEALGRVGVLPGLRSRSTDFLKLRVGDFSVGERQRIALARVLCRPAPIVILDEPDANLDRDGIQLVADLVTELARDRMVLVIAHSKEILALADRVVTLEDGKVRSDESQAAKRAG